MIPNNAQPLELTAARPAARPRALVDVAILIAAFGLFSLIALRMAPFVPDDSFISYRYAANLADGRGLRFNPTDEPVEGYSNFLWITLLAGAAWLGADLVAAGSLLGGLFGLLWLAALWWLLRRRGHAGWDLALPVGLGALSAPMLLYAVSGMETALFAFLLLAVLLAADAVLARPTAGGGMLLGLIGSLLALTRPEGVLAVPIVAVCFVALESGSRPDRRRAVWRAVGAAVLAFVVLQIAYHLWRVATFDAFWPTPFLAKGAAGGSLIDSWITNLRQFFVRQTHYYTPMVYYYAAIALPAGVAMRLAWRRGERRPVEWTALVLALGYAAVYLNFVDWMPGMRYYAPLVGLLLVPFARLGPVLRDPADGRAARRGEPAYLLLGVTLALFSLSGLAALRLDAQQLQAGTQASMVELGRWLGDVMPADSVLAMSDVGATPYYSGLRTIDVNPESLTDRHIAENGWSTDYFFTVDPDVVVLTAFSLTEPDFYGPHEALYALPRFQSAYERIGIVRNDWYQDRSYWVFVRAGHSPGPEQMATFPVGLHKP
jgi:hypothetical protein